jgi:arylsulfatase A-like enzyme
MHRVLAVFLAASTVLSVVTDSQATARQPNVVVILADDQGWGDLSVNGNSNLSTPHIDSLARDGATMQHFYVCPVCAPTRAEFLTGRYYPRTGVSGVSEGSERLNADEKTIADYFKAAGYTTGAFGKWHNGTQPPLHPLNRGFDEYYGFTSGHWGHYFSPPLDHNGTRVRGKGFIVDDFTDHAIKFIESNQERPFFCYLPLNTPHSPMFVPDRFFEKFENWSPDLRHRDPEKEDIAMTRAALALCENIDWNVGRVLATLDKLQLQNDTIVVYFSDNGPNSWRWNGGMKGRKGSIDEGGVRSPFFIRWPGHVRGGATYRQIGGAIDLLPTLTELSAVTYQSSKPLDGRSLAGLLLGGEDRVVWPDRLLFSTSKQQVSVRTQQFRLDNSGQLFDLSSDPGQQINVAKEHAALTERLRHRARIFAAEARESFAANADRPFTVGFARSTTLPARDGVAHGTIRRSSKAPNNSFFTNWSDVTDSMTWDVEINQDAEYRIVIYYTCAAGNEGVRLQFGADGGVAIETPATEVFDPPLYDKAKERVLPSHYFVKDFKALADGVLALQKGRTTLRLRTSHLKGPQVVDVHSIDLIRE